MTHTFALIAIPPVVFSITALSVSALALVIATLNFRRKSGVLIRGSYSLTSSTVETNDAYINSIILENLKDRAVTIFAIYVRVGHAYYICVRSDENQPLVLKPFETYTEKFGVPQFHVVNMKRIRMQKLLNDQRIKKRIVLSTSAGKYEVPNHISQWNPVLDYFQNLLTALIMPIYCTHKGVYLGENVRFVIELTSESGGTEIVPIIGEERGVRFRNFSLTTDSVKSKDQLEEFLSKQVRDGRLHERFAVYDLGDWQSRAQQNYGEGTIEAKPIGFFHYHILGRLATNVDSWRIKRENARRISALRSHAATAPKETSSGVDKSPPSSGPSLPDIRPSSDATNDGI